MNPVIGRKVRRFSHLRRAAADLIFWVYNLDMGLLIILFIVVPAVELTLLIEIGSRIGTVATLGLIVLTGFVGATLARMQGFLVLRRIQTSMNRGELPASSLVDGLIILIAGALLITPGILTDAVGFLCLVPGFRNSLKKVAWRWIEKQMQSQRIKVTVGGAGPVDGPSREAGTVYEMKPDEFELKQ